MDAEPTPMVLRSLVALTWARALAILDSPGGWGRFLASILAAVWSVSLWHNGVVDAASGTAALTDLLGVNFAALWMLGAAVIPMIGLVTGWLPLRVPSAVMSMFTWIWLLFEMATHGHLAHLSAGTCLVGVLACLRADVSLALAVRERYL
jgi:hypothetical protein